MGEAIAILIVWLIPLAILGIFFLITRSIESRRKRYLEAAEADLADIPCVALRLPPAELEPAGDALIFGEAAIANSYIRSFCAGFVNIFGGEVRSYTRLADDARRLALVRLKQQARERGAEYIYNVRFEGVSLSNPATTPQQQRGVGGMQIVVYGTAFRTRAR